MEVVELIADGAQPAGGEEILEDQVAFGVKALFLFITESHGGYS
jgi:hypothetical protein